MNKKQNLEAAETAQTTDSPAVVHERLVRLLPGDPVERYGPFTNLSFVGESDGHVTMRDRVGNEKRVYTSLFLKYAKFQPNAKLSHEEGGKEQL